MSFANSLNYVNLLSLEDYFFEQTDGAGMAHHSQFVLTLLIQLTRVHCPKCPALLLLYAMSS